MNWILAMKDLERNDVKLYWDEYEIGSSRKSFGRTITESDIVTHAGQTGDFYPNHMDAEWSATQPFGQRVAHGTLVFSVAVGLLANEVNEVAMSYGYDKVRFTAPVFIGDTIISNSKIVSKIEYAKDPKNFGIVNEQVEVVNQHGKTVVVFTHIYLVQQNQELAKRESR